MKKNSIKNLALAAMFMAVGLVLPFFTGQIPQVGSMLLPMHLPVLMCGLICGWRHGAVIGLILPLFRFMLFGMPPIFPTGLAMCFELAAYGLVSGLCYARLPKRLSGVFVSLIAAMAVGRVVWGVVSLALIGMSGKAFTFELFLSGAILTAIPGIILQLVFIPVMMVILQKAGVIAYEPAKASAAASATTGR